MNIDKTWEESADSIILINFGIVPVAITQDNIKLTNIVLRLGHLYPAFEFVSFADLEGFLQVEYCLLPMCWFLVGGSWQGYLFVTLRELTVEPGHEPVHFSLVIKGQLKISCIVKPLFGDCFEVNIIVLAGVREDIFAINGVDQWLG